MSDDLDSRRSNLDQDKNESRKRENDHVLSLSRCLLIPQMQALMIGIYEPNAGITKLFCLLLHVCSTMLALLIYQAAKHSLSSPDIRVKIMIPDQRQSRIRVFGDLFKVVTNYRIQ